MTNGAQYTFNLNVSFDNERADYETIHELLKNADYIQTEGLCIFQDFRRLSDIANEFKFLTDFINKCTMNSIEESQKYKDQMQEIADMKKALSSIKDRNERAKQKDILDRRGVLLKNMIQDLAQQIDPIPDWLINGLKKWIVVFNHNQIHLRLNPFVELKDFNIICNLKVECFTDSDLNHLFFSYGNKPNVPLTLLGLISTVPPNSKVEHEVEVVEQELDIEKDPLAQYKEVFDTVFEAIGGIDAFSRNPIYPNIKVYPIALYRNIQSFVE